MHEVPARVVPVMHDAGGDLGSRGRWPGARGSPLLGPRRQLRRADSADLQKPHAFQRLAHPSNADRLQWPPPCLDRSRTDVTRPFDQSAEAKRRQRYLTPRALSAALRSGTDVSDEDFNAFLPARIRGARNLRLTPVSAAVRGVKLLTESGARRVLDVGAGVGTFGIIGSLTTSAFFMGVEPDLRLVTAARGSAARFGADRARFFHGTPEQMDFRLYDAIHVFERDAPHPVGDLHQTDRGAGALAKTLTGRELDQARTGTRILTNREWQPPTGWRLVKTEIVDTIELRLFGRE